jgi:hypothetical protein
MIASLRSLTPSRPLRYSLIPHLQKGRREYRKVREGGKERKGVLLFLLLT